MKRLRTIAAGTAMALALVGCGDQASREKARADAAAAVVSEVSEALTLQIVKDTPEVASSLRLSDEAAGGPYRARLSDLSRATSTRLADEQAALYAKLKTVDRAALTGATRDTYDVLAATLKHMTVGASFGYGLYASSTPPRPYVVSQLTGVYQSAPDFLDSVHAIDTKQDAEDYLARLEAVATQIDQETERLKEDGARGVAPPAFIIDLTLQQMSELAGAPAPGTALVESIQERAIKAEGVTPVVAADMSRRAIELVREKIQPALRRQMSALEGLRARASNDPSVARLPKGEAYYRAALAAWTTTDLSPDEIHQMGLDLVKDITAQMDADLIAQGLKKGSVAERVQSLSGRKDQVYPNTDAGKAQLIADLNTQATAMSARLPEIFSGAPKAKLEIRRVPPAIEAGAPGGYYSSPAPDGSRPGLYYINLRNTGEWPRFTLPTLTYHEGVPGHHFQTAIAQEIEGLPLLRTAILGFGGYDEGWGLYAEQLADELGVYKDDPLGRIGYLQSMAFRAARLVVDTGLHAKGWTRQQAIDYMVSVTGDSPTAIATEVDRYIVWPGQACSYMVGRQIINRLRDKAKTTLGAKFELKAFHDVLLRGGTVPLSVLEQRVDDWIAVEKAKA